MQLCMYALHLHTGNSLYCRCIKASTIKKYILAVATFLALFGTHPRNFRKASPTDKKFTPLLKSVYNELEHWEKMPNRREPYTPEMQDDLEHANAAANLREDSLKVALAEWFKAGLFKGSRLTEWAQNASHDSIDNYQLDKSGDMCAFMLRDVTFEGQSKRQYKATDAIMFNHIDPIIKCRIKYHTQKNGENGEE